MMSRLFLLALLALVGLASGFAPVNTPSVAGKFNGGGIGEKREEKERGARKRFGWRRLVCPSFFSRRLLRRRDVGEIGPKRRLEDGRFLTAIFGYILSVVAARLAVSVRIHGEQRIPRRFGFRGRDEVSQSV